MNYEKTKIVLPDGFLTPVAHALYDLLNKGGAKTRFVGGCVRDLLLGRPPHDLDLATTLLPEGATKKLKAAGFKVEPIGLDHGTILAIKNGETFEITTLRQDVKTDGRHAEVKFTKDFFKDAARRDFTFNAFYMDIDGQVTDYFSGLEDLKKGIVRFVGEPQKRLEEDWLRALRFMRFYGRYGNTPPDGAALAALKTAAPHFKKLSRERKTAEFLKILATPMGPKALGLMADLGYLNALGLEGFNHKQYAAFCETFPRFKDGLEALMAAFWQTQQPFAFQAALFQNPHLRFSKKQKNAVRAVAPLNTVFLYPQNMPYTCWRLGAQNAARLWRQVAVAAHTHGTQKQAALNAAQKAEAFVLPKCPISGADVGQMGVADGPEIGHYLAQLQGWWAANNCPNKKACLAQLEQLLKTPPMVLVVPDVHGDLTALKALLESDYAQKASKIIFLGDYLDAGRSAKEFANIMGTATYVESCIAQDPRCVLLRGNHEQINAQMFGCALEQGVCVDTLVEPNKHQELMMAELCPHPQNQQFVFMERMLNLYHHHSADAARLTLGNGAVFVFTHAGWHADLLRHESAFHKAEPLGGATLERLALTSENMPAHSEHEAFWGQVLFAPEETVTPQKAFLRQPPPKITLVVGHHYSRRKNTMPEQEANVIFADTGAGKGGQLTALWLNTQTSEVMSLAPDGCGVYEPTPLSKKENFEPFERRIRKSPPFI